MHFIFAFKRLAIAVSSRLFVSSMLIASLALSVSNHILAAKSHSQKIEANVKTVQPAAGQSKALQAELVNAEKNQYINLSSRTKSALVAAHSVAFQILPERVRDPFIAKGPNGDFYLTGTTAGSHWGDTVGIRLWKSKNLSDWQDLGFVWRLHEDGKANNTWHFAQTIKHPDYKNPLAIWAPEIHFAKGTWWVTHSLNVGGHGLLKSTSGSITGPYEALAPVQTRTIDPHLFQEGDDVYYGWQANFLAKMNADMTQVVEPIKRLNHAGKHELGYEGILIVKLDDKYLHIASGRYGYEPSNTYDLYYAISKNLFGPYGERRMMIKNAGHGNIFQDHAGNWWSTAFDHQYTTNIDKKNKWSPWLVPIDFVVSEDDVLVIVKDERFRPNDIDKITVKKLAKEGKPEAWKGNAPWTLEHDLKSKTQ